MTEERVKGGFILLARRMLSSGIMKKPHLYLNLWVWLIFQASHKNHGGLKRGQLFTTTSEMRGALTYEVGNRKMIPTRKQIRVAYEYLRENEMIEISKGPHGMLITILKYSKYQNPEAYEGHTQEESKGQGKGQGKGTPKGPDNGSLNCENGKAFGPSSQPEGHAEGQGQGPGQGPNNKQEGTNKKKRNPEAILSQITALKDRYPSPDLIDQAFDAIRTTRKSGKVADSVLLAQLEEWKGFSPEQVQEGIRIYLKKECFADPDKNERYLLGIIRKQRVKPQFKEQRSDDPALFSDHIVDGLDLNDPEQFQEYLNQKEEREGGQSRPDIHG